MARNNELGVAKSAKKDEFYTQLTDIEKEMRYYHDFFRGKTVFCNCDDPYESNFFKFFAMNFNALGLKKLIATCYAGSPVAGKELEYGVDTSGQITFLPSEQDAPLTSSADQPYKVEITEVKDENNDGCTDLADVEYLMRNQKNTMTLLQGNGDFRSDECISLLKESDIIVTNPPFSLFREFIAQLIQYNKSFIIIGNMNAIHYKEVFPLIKGNRLWIGPSIHSGDRIFNVPDDYPLKAAGCGIDKNGRKFIRVKGVRWFTNIDVAQRHENLILYKNYDPEIYPKYTNYDAINVDSVSDIPCDYYDDMGVPDSFLDQYNPEQFEIIGLGCGDLAKQIGITKNYRGRTDLAYVKDGQDKCPYSRIIVRRKQGKVL